MDFSELYNKTILGLIAACLIFLVYEKKSPLPVTLSNKINTSGYTLVPVNKDGSINVRLISSDIIDVNIENIRSRDILNINLKELGGGYVRYNGPINVKLND